MRAAPKRRSPTVHELAQALADRYGTVMIRALEYALVLLDDRGATRVLALDGRQHPLGRGVKGRILETDESLTIEMVGFDWQRFDTYFLLNDRLVRMTDLKVRSQPRLEFRTVYDRPEAPPASDSLAAGLAGGAGQPAAIRIVPPERRVGELLSGRVEIETLIIDPLVGEVEFLLDGKRTRRVRMRPFTTRIGLADPPREQRLEALAYDRQGEYIGRDEILLNQIDRPFAVRIAKIRGAQANGDPAIRVAAAVSLPRAATLELVEFYRSEHLVSATHTFGEEGAPGAARTIPVEALIEGGRPVRRALVAVTDGADQHSRSQPEQSAELARRLGLPIYFIELDGSVPETANSSGVVAFNVTSTLKRQRARTRLSRISEQTGGRLFHIELYAATPRWTDRIEQVFDQIEDDLRHQHVLTYYSDQPLGAPVEPKIRVTRRGLSLRSAVPLEALE